ncbi:MAG: hypothetical protein IKL04_08785 [Lachnospiraceae bacterium]|nr:hypothetical protein [Lachnospiraceae bacterium]
MNPMTLMKLMQAKGAFEKEHPKFMAFLQAVFSRGITEDTVIEMTVTRPGEAPLTSNIKIKKADLELFEELKNLKN